MDSCVSVRLRKNSAPTRGFAKTGLAEIAADRAAAAVKEPAAAVPKNSRRVKEESVITRQIPRSLYATEERQPEYFINWKREPYES
jgi:hypothetical protein